MREMCIDLLIWADKFKFYLKWKGTRKELMFSKPLSGERDQQYLKTS